MIDETGKWYCCTFHRYGGMTSRECCGWYHDAILGLGGAYLGLLSANSDGWRHSLQNHGTPRFEARKEAREDFFATRKRLRELNLPIYRRIFPHEAT